jgi:hypothetical protein
MSITNLIKGIETYKETYKAWNPHAFTPIKYLDKFKEDLCKLRESEPHIIS